MPRGIIPENFMVSFSINAGLSIHKFITELASEKSLYSRMLGLNLILPSTAFINSSGFIKTWTEKIRPALISSGTEKYNLAAEVELAINE